MLVGVELVDEAPPHENSPPTPPQNAPAYPPPTPTNDEPYEDELDDDEIERVFFSLYFLIISSVSRSPSIYNNGYLV